MAIIISLPVLCLLLIFQSAVVSRIPLLQGTADLVLLAVIAWALQERVKTGWHWGVIGGVLVSIVSGAPPIIAWISYPASVGIAILLKRRVWKVPILAMFIATFFSVLLVHSVTIFALNALVLTGEGMNISSLVALNVVTMPSLLLNILAALPIYALMSSLAGWLYPEEIEV
jgi:rod shape-determining protein MreD